MTGKLLDVINDEFTFVTCDECRDSGKALTIGSIFATLYRGFAFALAFPGLVSLSLYAPIFISFLNLVCTLKG